MVGLILASKWEVHAQNLRLKDLVEECITFYVDYIEKTTKYEGKLFALVLYEDSGVVNLSVSHFYVKDLALFVNPNYVLLHNGKVFIVRVVKATDQFVNMLELEEYKGNENVMDVVDPGILVNRNRQVLMATIKNNSYVNFSILTGTDIDYSPVPTYDWSIRDSLNEVLMKRKVDPNTWKK